MLEKFFKKEKIPIEAIVNNKFYSTKTATKICSMTESFSNSYNVLQYNYFDLYKTLKGQYFTVFEGKICLKTIEKIKEYLIQNKKFDIYQSEFGILEEG